MVTASAATAKPDTAWGGGDPPEVCHVANVGSYVAWCGARVDCTALVFAREGEVCPACGRPVCPDCMKNKPESYVPPE